MDTKLGKDNKYIQDKLNVAFFDAFDTTGGSLNKLGKSRDKESVNLKKIRQQIINIKQYLDKGGRKINKASIPSDADIKKYSDLDPEQVDKLREAIKKYNHQKKSTKSKSSLKAASPAKAKNSVGVLKESNSFPIVGIGSSAGGLEALTRKRLGL